MQRTLRKIAFCCAIGLSAALGSTRSAVAGHFSSLQISPAYVNPNNSQSVPSYFWSYGYNINFDGVKLIDQVNIDFNFDADIATTETTFTAYLKSTIEGQWNNRFAIKNNGTGAIYPVGVEVVSTPSMLYDQTIQVSQGYFGDGANLLQWFNDDEPGVFAHEFGHALGLFDEYYGGAINQFPNPTLSSFGLMGQGARQAIPTMFSRYYTHFIADMLTIDPTGSYSVIPFLVVPEPATWLLLAIGLTVLLTRLKRRRQRASNY